MTVRQFIAEMLQYPNLDAEINFKANVANAECEQYDIPVEVNFTERDITDALSYDIIFSSKHADESMSNEESNDIHLLLWDNRNDEVNITLKKIEDTSNGIICITNQNGDVLREINVGGIHCASDNLMIILQSIL
jgi:galactitol-specific phosphotransferase system IIB component